MRVKRRLDCGRGRSSCPFKASLAQGQNNRRLRALKGIPRPLSMEPRVQHVTSFLAQVSSSSLFCGVRNIQTYLFFLQIFRGNWPMPLPLLKHSALVLFAQRTLISTSARSIGFCVIWLCISSSSSSCYLELD